MSLIHDVIKIKYIREGYLPNYPYHLISDKEMFDAFLRDDEGFFDSYYHVSYESLIPVVNELKSDMSKKINSDDKIPDWIYSYMLGEVISSESSQKDIHDLLVLLECDNINDEITQVAYERCLTQSKNWIAKNIISDRPPTCFGEPHVIKSLRVLQVSVGDKNALNKN